MATSVTKHWLRERLLKAFKRRDVANGTVFSILEQTTTDTVSSVNTTMDQLAATMANTKHKLSAANSDLDHHSTTSTPWFSWLVVAICFSLLGLTIAILYLGHMKAERAIKTPDDEDNLLANPN